MMLAGFIAGSNVGAAYRGSRRGAVAPVWPTEGLDEIDGQFEGHVGLVLDIRGRLETAPRNTNCANVVKAAMFTWSEKTEKIDDTIRYLMRMQGFVDGELYKTANDLWEKSGRRFASNWSLPLMTSICSLPNIDPSQAVRQITHTTHADVRCYVANVIYANILSSLCGGVPVDTIIEESIAIARKKLESEAETEAELSKWIKLGCTGVPGDFGLDLPVQSHYVFRSLACVLFTLQVIKKGTPNFRKVILRFAAEGGDTDINCGIVGAVLGAAGVNVE